MHNYACKLDTASSSHLLLVYMWNKNIADRHGTSNTRNLVNMYIDLTSL